MQTRREFLRGSAGALAGASAASLALAPEAQAAYFHPAFTGRHIVLQTKAANEIAAASAAALAAMANDHIFLVESFDYSVSSKVLDNLNIYWTHYNSSLEGLRNASYIPSKTQVELYDPEAQWSNTPQWDKDHMVEACHDAADLAHRRGWAFLGTPLDGSRPDICATISPFSDAVVIQAQHRQDSAQQYHDYVMPRAQDCRAADSNVIIMSGLATYNNISGLASGLLLYNCYQSVHPPVQGFWLNVNKDANGNSTVGIACNFLERLGPS